MSVYYDYKPSLRSVRVEIALDYGDQGRSVRTLTLSADHGDSLATRNYASHAIIAALNLAEQARVAPNEEGSRE